MSDWQVTETPGLKGYTCEWSEDGRFIFSRRNELFIANQPGELFTSLGSVPLSAWKRLAGRIRPLQRLLRQLIYNAVPLEDGSLFVSYAKSVGILKNGRYTPISGMRRPCRILRSAVAIDQTGTLYFGEYLSNKSRGPIRIYKLRPKSTRVEIAHEFEPGAVRHIHGIYFDPYTQSLWCLTGDFGSEARIIQTTDRFQTSITVGSDDETWRAVSVQFTETHIYYAMDAEFEPNGLYKIERVSGKRERIGELPGPVYYSRKIGEHLLFAVTAELCPSQTDQHASLWVLTSNDHLEKITEFRKDFLHTGYFLPATLNFPAGPINTNTLFFNTTAVKQYDNATFQLARVTHST